MDRDIFNKKKIENENQNKIYNNFDDYTKQKEKKLRIQAQKLYLNINIYIILYNSQFINYYY